MSERVSQRKGSYKKTFDVEDARRKRVDSMTELRKSKREEGLAKKRREGLPEREAVVPDNCASLPSDIKAPAIAPKVSDIPELVNTINISNEYEAQYDATLRIRKLLSIEKNPPIDQVIASGVVPRFVAYLNLWQYSKLQFEAAWALTNIASGTAAQTKVVVDSGAIPLFVQLLQSPDEEVRDQACWAIGNIAGDGTHGRDTLLMHNAMNALITVLTPAVGNPHRVPFMRTATWSLSNLCRGKPAPDFKLVSAAIPLLVRLLQTTDVETLTDACWALSYLTDGSNDKIGAVVINGACPHLVRLLSHESNQVNTPALRAVGNIVTGDETQTQAILDCAPSAVMRLRTFLESSRRGVRKEACWVVSNIAAGTSGQIQVLIDAGVFPSMIHLMSSAEFEVKREVCWALSNAISGGNNQQIAHLVKHQCLKPLCEMMTASDSKVVLVALEAVENILRSGAQLSAKTGNTNPYVQMVEEAEGLDTIDDLQNHSNKDIYQRAVRVLEEHFGAEEESENAPVNSNFNPAAGNMQFAF